jgi:ribosome biogenesis protein Tsr3
MHFRGIVLSYFSTYNCLFSAHGKKIISKEDKEIVDQHGIMVVDCSWAKI